MIADLRRIVSRLAELNRDMTDSDLPSGLKGKIIALHAEAGLILASAELAAEVADEKRRERAEEARRDALDDAREVRHGMEAWTL